MSSVTFVKDGVPRRCDNVYTRMITGQRFAIIDHLELESGTTIDDCPVAFKTFGRLSQSCDNVLVVCHALTGSADASDWWTSLFGPGKAIDHSRFFVFCANVLGSPYGSASSLTMSSNSGKIFGPTFPQTTVGDDVRAQKLVLDALGVRSIAAVMGGSMGGMAVLEWAVRMKPGYISTIIPIATAASTSAWGMSWNEAQRNCIIADPKYNGGWYEPVPSGQPCGGMSAARMVAMLTYRSAHSFEERFGRTKCQEQRRVDSPQPSEDAMPDDNNKHMPQFAAQSYLQHQGRKFVRRFDANCYLHLLEKLNRFDATSGVLRNASMESLVVGVGSDVLFLPSEQARLAKSLPKATLHMLESMDGHDGFLLEFDELNRIIPQHLRELCPQMFEAEALTLIEDSCTERKSCEGVGEEW